MPRKIYPVRSLSAIFRAARECGERNVLLNDGELGRVLAGSDVGAYAPGTVSNMRSVGRLTTPVIRIGRQTKTRLSDALDYLDRRTEGSADD